MTSVSNINDPFASKDLDLTKKETVFYNGTQILFNRESKIVGFAYGDKVVDLVKYNRSNPEKIEYPSLELLKSTVDLYIKIKQILVLQTSSKSEQTVDEKSRVFTVIPVKRSVLVDNVKMSVTPDIGWDNYRKQVMQPCYVGNIKKLQYDAHLSTQNSIVKPQKYDNPTPYKVVKPKAQEVKLGMYQSTKIEPGNPKTIRPNTYAKMQNKTKIDQPGAQAYELGMYQNTAKQQNQAITNKEYNYIKLDHNAMEQDAKYIDPATLHTDMEQDPKYIDPATLHTDMEQDPKYTDPVTVHTDTVKFPIEQDPKYTDPVTVHTDDMTSDTAHASDERNMYDEIDVVKPEPENKDSTETKTKPANRRKTHNEEEYEFFKKSNPVKKLFKPMTDAVSNVFSRPHKDKLGIYITPLRFKGFEQLKGYDQLMQDHINQFNLKMEDLWDPETTTEVLAMFKKKIELKGPLVTNVFVEINRFINKYEIPNITKEDYKVMQMLNDMALNLTLEKIRTKLTHRNIKVYCNVVTKLMNHIIQGGHKRIAEDIPHLTNAYDLFMEYDKDDTIRPGHIDHMGKNKDFVAVLKTIKHHYDKNDRKKEMPVIQPLIASLVDHFVDGKPFDSKVTYESMHTLDILADDISREINKHKSNTFIEQNAYILWAARSIGLISIPLLQDLLGQIAKNQNMSENELKDLLLRNGIDIDDLKNCVQGFAKVIHSTTLPFHRSPLREILK